LSLLAPGVRQGVARLVEYTALELSRARAMESLMAIAEICQVVDQHGLPAGGRSDAA